MLCNKGCMERSKWTLCLYDCGRSFFVRAIVGTLIEVGRGKRSVEEFKAIIDGRDRALAGTSAPPQGLFLPRVDYPAEIYKD